jgi:hypothetical protein
LPKKKIPPRRKKRTREHVIADLSVNFVERHILLAGHSVERIIHDYGMDLLMHTYNADGEVEAGEVYLQLKATDQLKILADGKSISFRIETADLQYWLAEPSPVILVVFDALREEAFWLYVQAFFQKKKKTALDLTKREMTLRVPRANRLDAAAIARFAEFNRHVLAQRQGIEHHE